MILQMFLISKEFEKFHTDFKDFTRISNNFKDFMVSRIPEDLKDFRKISKIPQRFQ